MGGSPCWFHLEDLRSQLFPPLQVLSLNCPTCEMGHQLWGREISHV